MSFNIDDAPVCVGAGNTTLSDEESKRLRDMLDCPQTEKTERRYRTDKALIIPPFLCDLRKIFLNNGGNIILTLQLEDFPVSMGKKSIYGSVDGTGSLFGILTYAKLYERRLLVDIKDIGERD